MIQQPTTDLTTDEVLNLKMLDALNPGVIIELDPDEAELLGAFHEHALTEAEAMESTADMLTIPG